MEPVFRTLRALLPELVMTALTPVLPTSSSARSRGESRLVRSTEAALTREAKMEAVVRNFMVTDRSEPERWTRGAGWMRVG